MLERKKIKEKRTQDQALGNFMLDSFPVRIKIMSV
jgi:hypothetical protein